LKGGEATAGDRQVGSAIRRCHDARRCRVLDVESDHHGSSPQETIMKFHRVDYTQQLPAAFKGLAGASAQVHNGVIGAELAELLFLRVSQINGCAYCLDMHTTALVNAGVEPRKIATVAGWRESRFFDARERAALDWAEALTRLADAAPPADALYEALAAQFDEKGIAEVTMAVAVINAWNRLGVGLQPELA